METILTTLGIALAAAVAGLVVHIQTSMARLPRTGGNIYEELSQSLNVEEPMTMNERVAQRIRRHNQRLGFGENGAESVANTVQQGQPVPMIFEAPQLTGTRSNAAMTQLQSVGRAIRPVPEDPEPQPAPEKKRRICLED